MPFLWAFLSCVFSANVKPRLTALSVSCLGFSVPNLWLLWNTWRPPAAGRGCSGFGESVLYPNSKKATTALNGGATQHSWVVFQLQSSLQKSLNAQRLRGSWQGARKTSGHCITWKRGSLDGCRCYKAFWVGEGRVVWLGVWFVFFFLCLSTETK